MVVDEDSAAKPTEISGMSMHCTECETLKKQLERITKIYDEQHTVIGDDISGILAIKLVQAEDKAAELARVIVEIDEETRVDGSPPSVGPPTSTLIQVREMKARVYAAEADAAKSGERADELKELVRRIEAERANAWRMVAARGQLIHALENELAERKERAVKSQAEKEEPWERHDREADSSALVTLTHDLITLGHRHHNSSACVAAVLAIKAERARAEFAEAELAASHHVNCNGDRRVRVGSPGVTCNCRQTLKGEWRELEERAVVAEEFAVKAGTRLVKRHIELLVDPANNSERKNDPMVYPEDCHSLPCSADHQIQMSGEKIAELEKALSDLRERVKSVMVDRQPVLQCPICDGPTSVVEHLMCSDHPELPEYWLKCDKCSLNAEISIYKLKREGVAEMFGARFHNNDLVDKHLEKQGK